MSEQDQPDDLGPPPPRESQKTSLQRQAESIVKLYGITFGNFKGARCIYPSTPLPDRDYNVLKDAMQKGLI